MLALINPSPRTPVSVRVATMSDLPFIDSLQKCHTKQVGFMHTAALEGKIGRGQVLVAEESGLRSVDCGMRNELDQSEIRNPNSAIEPVGYCIGHDQYFKRDDVGIIYQLNVVPGKRRSLVGAMLIKAVFDRAAWGCKLFCCWCAQDLEANRFWEALGFVPLAFRAGARGKRVHIFWQRRIRSGDVTTPYWFPSQTNCGAIREDRLVLPIPPGVRWSDEMPMILPREENPKLPSRNPKQIRSTKPKVESINQTSITSGGLHFVVPEAMSISKPKKTPKQRVKNDPKLVAGARELRDRWLEEVNAGNYLPEAEGKYEISRVMGGAERRLLAG